MSDLNMPGEDDGILGDTPPAGGDDRGEPEGEETEPGRTPAPPD